MTITMDDGDTVSLQFRGLRIIKAVLTELVFKHGLDPHAQVIFGGGSAGGRGAMAWLDYAHALLPTSWVHGFLDSAYYLDMQSYSASSLSGSPKSPSLQIKTSTQTFF